MSGVLLDTNVLSELVNRTANPVVRRFVASQENAWLSIITLHELDYGIGRLPEGRRKRGLKASITELLDQYQDRVIPVGLDEAAHGARLRAVCEAQGQTLHLADALIAGTAAAHELQVATRNTRDFSGCGIAVVNPWENA